MYWLLLIISLLLSACDLFDSGGKNGPGEDDEPLHQGKIVFAVKDQDGTYQIATINADGSDLRQLTDMLPSEEAVYPSWSPDGREIVFSSWKFGTSTGPALWIMTADGTNQRVLYDSDPDNIDVPPLPGNWPRWSPDGMRVAFNLCLGCQVGTNVDIYVFDTRTREIRRLTDQPTDRPGSHGYPSWSPDGERIAFMSNRDYLNADTLRYRRDLYVMEADGSNQRRLTDIGYVSRPVWNPDGRTITFRSTEASSNALFEVDVASGDTSRIPVSLSEEFAFDPVSWSSDGRYLLVTTRHIYPPVWSLQLIDRASGMAHVVFSASALNSNPLILGADWFTGSALNGQSR